MPTRDAAANELRGIFFAVSKKIPGADQRLLALLHDRDWETRLEAVRAIHEKRWMPFARRLGDRLIEEQEPEVADALIAACGEMRTAETFEALLTYAKGDLEAPSDRRTKLLTALRLHNDERARPYFEEVFAPELCDKEQRILAAWALLKMGAHPGARAFLIAMLEHPGQSQRAAIADLDLKRGASLFPTNVT